MPSGLERPNSLIAALLAQRITPQPSGQRYFGGLLGVTPQQPQMTVGNAVEAAAGIAPGIGDAMDFDAMRQNWQAGNYGRAALAGAGLIGLPLAALGGAMRIASSDAPGMLGRGGRRLGGMLGMYPDQAGIIGYHGSPHKFAPTPNNPLGEFDPSKVGTGEGAQAYGRGAAYIAEDRRVGESYRDALGKIEILHNGNPVGVFDESPAANAAHNIRAAGGDIEKAVKRANAIYTGDFRAKVIDEIRRLGPGDVTESMRGHLYTVDIPDDDIPKMLDWNKPLKEQPGHVQAAVRSLVKKAEGDAAVPGALSGAFTWSDHAARYGSPQDIENMDGASIIDMLQKVYGVSVTDELHSLGIKGIKYLDAASRQAGDGTRNYVVFDPKRAKIINVE